MSVSDKLITAILKYGLIFILMIIMTLSQKLSAQEKEWESPRVIFSGLETSFGVKVSQIKSPIKELDGLTLVSEGGNAGIVFGSSFSQLTVKPLGLYAAIGSIGRTINLYTFEVENNTYLLKGIINKPTRFDLFSTLGLNFHSNKFFGHYIAKDERPNRDLKPGKEPYLGKIETLLISVGLGAEYKVLHDLNFVHLFLAGKYQVPMQLSADSRAFEKTSLNKNFDLSIGLRFGLMEVKSNNLQEL